MQAHNQIEKVKHFVFLICCVTFLGVRVSFIWMGQGHIDITKGKQSMQLSLDPETVRPYRVL